MEGEIRQLGVLFLGNPRLVGGTSRKKKGTDHELEATRTAKDQCNLPLTKPQVLGAVGFVRGKVGLPETTLQTKAVHDAGHEGKLTKKERLAGISESALSPTRNDSVFLGLLF